MLRRDSSGADPCVPFSLFETTRVETNDRLKTVEGNVISLQIDRAEMRGAMKIIKLLPIGLALILSALGYDLAGHHLGWFEHAAKVVAEP